jgi:hypothetical protein
VKGSSPCYGKRKVSEVRFSLHSVRVQIQSLVGNICCPDSALFDVEMSTATEIFAKQVNYWVSLLPVCVEQVSVW